MNILYHLTVLPPKMPEGEALSQEISALRRSVGGNLVYLNPNQRSPVYVPRFLFGFQLLGQLRRLESDLDLHHVYNPDAFAFPIFRRLRRPVIYSISSGVGEKRPNLDYFASMAAVLVSDRRSLTRLRGWGLDNAHLVKSGIDLSRFNYSACPLKDEFRLLVGSAPWTENQFRTKGVEALLGSARQDHSLHLVFLWRGVLTAEMGRRVRAMGLEKQVEVLDEKVDVNRILGTVHASIALASAPGIIKSYPHSLLDSLAAGKPVLVSRAIPMSDYVDQVGCGLVVESVTPAAILHAVRALAADYRQIQARALTVGQTDFSQTAMVASFLKVYDEVLRRSVRGL
jgi:glycosyltransferase involved in cell wall biosynthesis